MSKTTSTTVMSNPRSACPVEEFVSPVKGFVVVYVPYNVDLFLNLTFILTFQILRFWFSVP